jgi:hypothetical protein
MCCHGGSPTPQSPIGISHNNPPIGSGSGPNGSPGNTCVNGTAPPCSGMSPEDEALIQCILQLCATDPDVVARARTSLTLYSRQPKQIQLQRYQQGHWVTTRTVTSGGTTRGTSVWINRGEDCTETKGTVYHEVTHTMPWQQSMNSRDREIDAYTRTTQWMINRGLPGDFQTLNPDGTRSVDNAAIVQHVDGAYGYSSGVPRIVGRQNSGNTVVLEDGSTRPARDGDTFQYTPTQDLQERQIPPDRLQCP